MLQLDTSPQLEPYRLKIACYVSRATAKSGSFLVAETSENLLSFVCRWIRIGEVYVCVCVCVCVCVREPLQSDLPDPDRMVFCDYRYLGPGTRVLSAVPF